MKTKTKYETLDEYLDDLDAIKEKVAKATEGMTHQQVMAYFEGAADRLQKVTGKKVRVRRPNRKSSDAKR